MTTQDNAWTTRKTSRGASRACNPETEFRAGHSSRDAEVAELKSDLEVAEGILGAHAHAVPQIIAERDAYLAQRDASRAVNADLLAAQRPEVLAQNDLEVKAAAIEAARDRIMPPLNWNLDPLTGNERPGTSTVDEIYADVHRELTDLAAEIRAAR